MSGMKVGHKNVGEGQPCFFIGEIGINHNGSLDIAKKLIDVAVDAGCDAVKFQKRTLSAVYSEEELARPREVPPEIIVGAIRRGALTDEAIQRLTASNFLETTNGDLKSALEFNKEEYQKIDEYCRERNILWFASPWDEGSVDFLKDFDPVAYKIASASLTDLSLLKKVRQENKPIFLSTGMSTIEEVDQAVEILGKEDLSILHCVSTYPSQDQELNLSVIKTLQKKYPGIPIGYSGHEKGVTLSVNAVALGACIVERHFTLDRAMWGSDQAASLEPKGLQLLGRDIRNFESAIGDGVKRLLDSEIPIKEKLRRKP